MVDGVDAVDAYLLLNAATQLFEKAPSDLDESQWKEAVTLAEKESLMQAAILASEEAGSITIEDDAVAGALKDVEERYPSRHAFLEDLVRNGLNETTLSESLKHALKVERVMERVAAEVSISDEEMTEFYHANEQKFSRPELREARHILITINPQFPENTRKASKARIKKISAELAASKQSFAELAMRHSECPTALDGGSLGKLPQGKLYPQLDAVLFAMSEGELSQVIESPVGLHLLRCDRIHEAGIASLEEAEPIIREHLLGPRVRMAQKQWIKSLFNQ